MRSWWSAALPSSEVLRCCKEDRGSWKRKGGMDKQSIRQERTLCAFGKTCASTQQWQILPGSLVCILWAGSGWSCFESHRPTLLHRRQCIGRRVERPSNAKRFRVCTVVCSTFPSACSRLPSFHTPKYQSPETGDCRQCVK